MNEIIKIDPKEYGLEPSKATELTTGLKVVRAERALLIKEFEVVSVLEITEENLPKFKELRLKITKNRTQGTNKWHKTNKEYFLTGGRFVDAIKNRDNDINERMEDKLMEAERHFENIEKERIEALQKERVESLSKYVEDAHLKDLAGMDQDVWDAYLAAKQKEHTDKVAADAKAERERIEKEKAEAIERERIRLENIELKKQAEERERVAAIEADKRAKEESKRIANELVEKKKREDKAAKIQAENDAKLKAEREEREKVAAELQAKKDADEKARLAEEQRIQSELNKGDSDKLNDLVSDLQALKTKYKFKSDKNKKMLSGVCELIDKVTQYINR